ncbi:MAG: helix-turn-helix domain-containing protein [bacterium]|nr:helix-turn-helix domain-containing protein [bacterium]
MEERFFADVKLAAELEEARATVQVADLVHSLRQQSGLTQRELARRIGTGASVICRLENDEYRGQGLSMLRRIAHALDLRVVITIKPQTPKTESPF